MQTIPFDDFMAGTSFSSTFSFNLNLISMTDVYWIVGGTGAVLIGLYWMESKGWIKVNDNTVKISLIIIYAAIIGKFLLSSSIWGLF